MPITTSTTVMSSHAPSNFEDNVVFTASIVAVSSFPGGPTGSVQFWDGVPPSLGGSGALITTVPLTPLTGATGQAQLQMTTLTEGVHVIVAVYSGDVNFATSNNYPPGFIQQVNQVPVSGGVIPGLGLVATFQATGDSSLPPQAVLSAVPSTTPPNQSVILLWDTVNVGQIEITGNNHIDYQAPPPPGSAFGFDTGRITTTGSGIYVVGNGFTANITLTLTAYDSTGHPLGLTSTVTITVT